MNSSERKITLITIFRRLFPMVFAATPVLFILFNILGMGQGMIVGVNTMMLQRFFDTVQRGIEGTAGLPLVIGMALAVGGVRIGSELLNGVINFIGNTMFKKGTGYLTMRIHEKAARIEPIEFENPTRLDDINKAEAGMQNGYNLLVMGLGIFTIYMPYFVFMAVYLYHLQPILAISMLFIFIPVLLNQFIKGRLHAKLEDESAPLRREFKHYEQCISGREFFKETRMLGAFRYFQSLYWSTLKLFREKKWKVEKKTGLMELGMKMLTLAGYFGVLYLLFALSLKGEISIGAFAAVFASLGTMFELSEELISKQIGTFTKQYGTVRNFIRFLDLPERKGKDASIRAGNGIILDRVSFRYPGSDAYALKDVSLELKKGETIAIVGENGAGKSTLIQLMIGLYLPSEGTVMIDGHDTKDISPASIYATISAVFQKFQRYKMTLKDNIRISQAGEDPETMVEAKVESAAKKAELDGRSAMFPSGYDTMLSREFNGIDLSGGQWQRVAIARGFYRVHDLIVLDEPTAAIDPLEETRIYEKFAELAENHTAILVTHRLGSARIADRIIVLDQGRIVECGTHDELLRLGGKYADMYQAQAQWYVFADPVKEELHAEG